MWTGRSVLVPVVLSHLPSVQECFGEGLGYPHQDKQSLALARLGMLPPQGRGWCSSPSLSKPEFMTWVPWGEVPPCPLTCWTLSLQAFESWMHKWLLFEMAKNTQSEDHKAIPAEKGIGGGTAELGRVREVLGWGISQGTKTIFHHRASLPSACRAFGVNKRLNSCSPTPNPSLVSPIVSERSLSRGLFTFNCFWIESHDERKGLGADGVSPFYCPSAN